MNDHDAERITRLLEDDGLRRVDSVDDADVLVYNTCTVRHSADDRLAGHLGEAARVKALDPGRVVWSPAACRRSSARRSSSVSHSSMSPWAAAPARVAEGLAGGERASAAGRGSFDGERALSGELPTHRERPFQAWVQIIAGLQQPLLVLHRAHGPRPRAQPHSRGRGRRGEESRSRRRARGHPARPERQCLRRRPPRPRPADLRRPAAGVSTPSRACAVALHHVSSA